MHSNNGESSFDLTIALAHVDGDRALLQELATMLIDDYSQFIKEMKDAILQCDYPTLERTAHTLKGRFAFFGIQDGIEKALELEHMGHDGNASGALETLAAMDAALEKIWPAIQSLSRASAS